MNQAHHSPKPVFKLRWLIVGASLAFIVLGFMFGLGDVIGLSGEDDAPDQDSEFSLALATNQTSNTNTNHQGADATGSGTEAKPTGESGKTGQGSGNKVPMKGVSPILVGGGEGGDASQKTGPDGRDVAESETKLEDSELTSTTFDPAKVGRRSVSRNGLGDLVVTVVSADTKSAVSGAEVIAPLNAAGVVLKYGQLTLPESAKGTTKRSDAQGEARFALQELNLAGVDAVSVIVRAFGKVPVVKQVRKADLQGKHAQLRIELATALRVTGNVANKKGERVPNARMLIRAGEITQTQLDNSFFVTAGNDGSFQFDVAANFAYQLVASADGYVTNVTQRFDFRRDERVIAIILQEGKGVEGYVYAGGAAAAGASIKIVGRGEEVIADGSGHFVLVGLPDQVWTNTFTVRVAYPNFAPVVREVVVNEQALEIRLPNEATITGRVIENGLGIIGATLYGTLHQGKQDYPVLESLSGVDGVFRVGSLGSGRLTLRARTTDGKFSQPYVVNLKDGEAKENIELVLGVGGELNLQVRSMQQLGPFNLTGFEVLIDGNPIYDDDGDGIFTASGLSDGTHSIALASLPSAVIPATLAGQAVFAAKAVGNSTVRYFALPGASSVNLKLGELTEHTIDCVEVNAAEDRSINVRLVLDRPSTITDVEVKLVGASIGPQSLPITRKVTIQGGSALIEGIVLAGNATYTVSVKHPRIQEVTLDNSQIEGLEDGDTLTIQLLETLSLRGYIKDSSGNALPATSVSLSFGGNGVGNASSDQLGYFEIGGLEAGNHHLTAFKHSYYQFVKDYEVSWSNIDPVEIVILGANEIRITVEDANGSPVVGANVRLSRPSSDNPISPIEYFNVGGTDGTGKKIVNFHWIRHYQVYAYHNNKMGYINFDNLREEPVREFTLTLEPSTTITGSVVSATSGQPVGDIDVFADYLDSDPVRGSNEFYARANNAGVFSVTVPIGSFDMVGRASRAYQEGRMPSVQGGQSNIVVQVDPKDDVEGNWAEFISMSLPGSITAGAQFTALVTVRNRGSTVWSEGTQHRLGSQSPQDNNRWGTGRASIPAGVSVAPGTTYTFTLTLTAPATAGVHNMQWRMLQERREWFGEYSGVSQVTVVAQ